MLNEIQVLSYRLSDPRKLALILTLVLVVLALAGSGDVAYACPSADSGSSGCGGG